MQRVGNVTASRVVDVLATLKNGSEAASRTNYRAELVAERMTGVPYPQFESAAMRWGTETEPEARMAYSVATGNSVERVGYIEHPRIQRFGASPDGLIEEDGLVEIKCPNTATHIQWILGGAVPAEHQPQMLAQMACTGRKWCDFVSYDPRMPERRRLFVKRFERDDARINEMEAAVEAFLQTVDDLVRKLSQDDAA